jgi:hypothetical protein
MHAQAWAEAQVQVQALRRPAQRVAEDVEEVMGGMGCQVCHDSPCTCTFMTSAVAGHYDGVDTDLEEAFCDAVEEWHKGDGLNGELHEFLGMTQDEYRRVVEKPTELARVVEDRRKPKIEPRRAHDLADLATGGRISTSAARARTT